MGQHRLGRRFAKAGLDTARLRPRVLWVLSETADFFYKCTAFYSPETERSVRWDDPESAIEWPIETRSYPIRTPPRHFSRTSPVFPEFADTKCGSSRPQNPGNLGRALKAPLRNSAHLPRSTVKVWTSANPEALRPRLSELKPNLIVNAAAYTNVDGAESDPETALAINGKAPDVLAGWAAENEASIVHFSTDYVYDGGGDQPRAESDPCNPANAYGQSKLAGDQAVLSSSAPPHAYCEQAGYIPKQGRTSFAQCYAWARNGKNCASWTIRLARRHRQIYWRDRQSHPATGGRRYIGIFKKERRLYHAAAAGETSWYGFATEIFTMARRRNFKLAVQGVTPIPSTEYPLPATRPTNSRLAPTKLENTFGISPPL